MKDHNAKPISNATKKILLSLADTAGSIFESGMRSYRVRPYLTIPRAEIAHDRRRFEEQGERRKLRELEKQKLIELKFEGNKILYRLTDAGYESALKTEIFTTEAMLPEGEVCIVVFDVPEDIRRVRSSFRELLKKSDFRMIQKSVWEGERDVIFQLRDLIKLIKAEDYILVYRALAIR
ncbi:MAG: CRISPR-associated endonuclease Cas2 [Candidatus Uhrbacteria bacterium]|nr:CRISPR-associated endonuclease Cas2 [Candidatus Uhrbacteria bacterium]